ncbi:helix-turn-helix domain-containing protein [Hymenobacter sp. YC55]|uniref:helix-turn-helix domain-containing protein n=1 Tax=Hymenobacter sp. YC55 TaxID=3034019 RepID=UPI0023F63995|nr:helix-turn-helix domain-containing protein [Hymenobacter sp. YC55]MDF7810734.1 helix-turn-helix domain-containing protein [Hymenobacter sp. YC55]
MILVDFNQEPIKSMLMQAFHSQSLSFLEQQPKPDPQYTCEQVADILNVDVDTVRSYLKLPAGHRRHLAHVQTSDSARGNRIRLSAVQDWQERNNATQVVLEEAQLIVSHRRPARRNKAA